MGIRVLMRLPIMRKALSNAELTTEEECDWYAKVDVSGYTDLASLDLIFTYSYVNSTSRDWLKTYIYKVTGRIQFLDASDTVLEENSFTFQGANNTLSYTIPSGTAYIKLIIDTIQYRRDNGGNYDWNPYGEPDSVNSSKNKPDFLKIQIKDSSGTVLDEVSFRANEFIVPPINASSTYIESGVSPQLEISYSLVNTLQYARYVGLKIDEVSGVPADTDKLYFELYQDDTLLDQTFVVGSDIAVGQILKLPQSPTQNSNANKIVVRVESQRYFTVRGHIIWDYDPFISTEAY